MASSQGLAVDRESSQDRAQLGYRYALKLAIVFALHFGAGKLGLAVPFTSSNVSPIWPSAGIAVPGVLIWGVQIAPAIAFAAFLVNFLTPIPTSACIAIGLGNASSAVVAGRNTSILESLRALLRSTQLSAKTASSRSSQQEKVLNRSARGLRQKASYLVGRIVNSKPRGLAQTSRAERH